jgi:uncharacterized membrane protein YphA (DoxX/SURF4 family)
MPVVHVLAHLSAAVLVLSGIAKVRQPTALVQPLRTLHLPATRRAARAIGVVEVGVGVATLVSSHAAAMAALALVWIGLLAAAVGLSRDAGADCGCFGEASRPVGPVHLVVNTVFSIAAVASTFDPAPAIWDLPDAPALGTATYVLLLVVGAGAVSALLTAPLPVSAGRPAAARGRTHATTPRNEAPA